MLVEFKVRPAGRYIVTRYEDNANGDGSTQVGEYASAEVAYHVAYALCRTEHEKSGEPVDSKMFVYPQIPDDAEVPPQ